MSFVRDDSDLRKEWTLPFIPTSNCDDDDDRWDGALLTEGAKAEADATKVTITAMESFIAVAVQEMLLQG